MALVSKAKHIPGLSFLIAVAVVAVAVVAVAVVAAVCAGGG
jgi:hypothetical protein